MDRKLTIVLIEDDQEVCKDFSNAIEKYHEELDIVAITKSSDEAIEHIKYYIPDAIILDLELHKGKGDGLSLLDELSSSLPHIKPYVLITTDNFSPIVRQQARNTGADFVMTKTQEGYSVNSALKHIFKMKEILLKQVKKNPKTSPTETPALKEKRIKYKICSELDHLGVSPKLLGRQYLVEAIWLVVNGPTPYLCDTIAKKYKKSESSVERAIQTALNKVWNTSDPGELYSLYDAKINSEKGVPTITEFVSHYAEKIRRDFT